MSPKEAAHSGDELEYEAEEAVPWMWFEGDHEMMPPPPPGAGRPPPPPKPPAISGMVSHNPSAGTHQFGIMPCVAANKY